MRYAYPAEVLEESDGVTVSFPDVPGAITCGDTRAEALERGQDALISMLSVYVGENRALPRPSPARGRPLVPVTALDGAKLALHDAMLGAKMSNVELGRRLGMDEKQVRRLRDPLHQSHIGKVEAALRILGKRLEVEVKEAA
jgi:antitoxin HicB